MLLFDFPDPRSADSDGIVLVGGNLYWKNLIRAYRKGIFPWPHPGYPLLWFSPDPRAILQFDDLHLSRSVRRLTKKHSFRFTVDRAFPEVIRQCASVERDDHGTWIIPSMIDAYMELHRRRFAHTVEVWEGDRLVGGIYGVDAGGAFAAESMFRLVPDASKLALLHLIDHLKSRGAEWLDVQVMSPHLEALGAKEIPRDEYLRRLGEARARGVELF